MEDDLEAEIEALLESDDYEVNSRFVIYFEILKN